MKKFKKVISIILAGLLSIFLLAVLVIGIGRAAYKQKYKIDSDTGIQKSEYVTLGGIEQYIQIRGNDSDNPVIIVLHGGPGSNMGYYSYYWQTPLEEKYTIVHWDQRGCGNTFYQNKGEAEEPDLELLVSDLDELVDYICNEYKKEDVIIMGHSWGTVLGGVYALEHPAKISHYIAVGQMVHTWSGERAAANEAIRLAEEAGKSEKGRAIESQYQKIVSNDEFNIEDFIKYRNVTGEFLPTSEGMSVVEDLTMGLFSPYATLNDWKWQLLSMTNLSKYAEPNYKLYNRLFTKEGFSMYDYASQYEIPVTFITGDSDWTTPYVMVEEYFDKISAPEKQLLYIENAGHSPFLDKPETFNHLILNALENDK